MVNVNILSQEIQNENTLIKETILNIIKIYGEVQADRNCSENQAQFLDEQLKKLNSINPNCCSYSEAPLESKAHDIIEDCGVIFKNIDSIWPSAQHGHSVI